MYAADTFVTSRLLHLRLRHAPCRHLPLPPSGSFNDLAVCWINVTVLPCLPFIAVHRLLVYVWFNTFTGLTHAALTLRRFGLRFTVGWIKLTFVHRLRRCSGRTRVAVDAGCVTALVAANVLLPVVPAPLRMRSPHPSTMDYRCRYYGLDTGWFDTQHSTVISTLRALHCVLYNPFNVPGSGLPRRYVILALRCRYRCACGLPFLVNL